MAISFGLTQQPIRYTTASGAGFQPMYLAVDISRFDLLDMEAGLVAVEGTLTSFTLDLYTANQKQTDDGWVPLGSTLFTGTTTNTWQKVAYTSGLLRYLRWRVTSISGGTAATFFIRGMGRSYSGSSPAMAGPAARMPAGVNPYARAMPSGPVRR